MNCILTSYRFSRYGGSSSAGSYVDHHQLSQILRASSAITTFIEEIHERTTLINLSMTDEVSSEIPFISLVSNNVLL
jgi:hypothetical protein